MVSTIWAPAPAEAGQERPGLLAAHALGGHPGLDEALPGIEGAADLAGAVYEELPALAALHGRRGAPGPP